MSAGDLPDLQVTDGSRDSFKNRDDEALDTVLPCAIINIVFVEHGRKGQENSKGMGS